MRTLLPLAALALAGCMRVEMDIPKNLPEKPHETERAVAATITPEQARTELARILKACRTPAGSRMRATLGPARFQWGYRFVLPLGNVETHDFDFGYAEVTPKIVDLSSLGGREGIQFYKDGQAVDFAWCMTPTLADAQTLVDCMTVLAK